MTYQTDDPAILADQRRDGLDAAGLRECDSCCETLPVADFARNATECRACLRDSDPFAERREPIAFDLK